MEFILIHKAIVPLPPEAGKAMFEFGRKLLAKPGEVVPGGKLIASYAARGQWTGVCIWDVPNVEALMPFLEQMSAFGWNNEVIPAEKMEVHMEKLAKALEAKR